MTFFFFIPKASVHNFADANTLCSFTKTLRGLVTITILQSECETSLNWLHSNKMIVNPDKFQVTFLDKRNLTQYRNSDRKRKNQCDFDRSC